MNRKEYFKEYREINFQEEMIGGMTDSRTPTLDELFSQAKAELKERGIDESKLINIKPKILVTITIARD